MVERKRVRKIPSDEIQGEGSWVVVARITVGEIRTKQKAGRKKGADIFGLTMDILKTHVLEWNWVDDDGEPLPQPKDDPDVIDQLVEFETVFLANHITGSEADAKN